MSVKTRMDPTMTHTTHKVTAGLVFLGMRALDITAITKRIAHTLDQLGVELTAQRCLSEEAAVLRTRDFDLRVTIERKRHIPKLDLPADHYIGLTLMREDGPLWTDPEASQTVLAQTLAALQRLFGTPALVGEQLAPRRGPHQASSPKCPGHAPASPQPAPLSQPQLAFSQPLARPPASRQPAGWLDWLGWLGWLGWLALLSRLLTARSCQVTAT